MSVEKSPADVDWGHVEMAEAGLPVNVPRVITTMAKPASVCELLNFCESVFFY